jgi:hypothetical protein
MILRSFASNQPYALVFAVAVVFAAYTIPDSSTILFAKAGYSSENLISCGNTLGVFVCIALILTAGLLANRLFNQNEFMNTPVYTPALMYMILMTTLGMTQTHMSTAASNIMVIMGLSYQIKIFKQPSIAHEIVLSGFFYGLATLIIPSQLTLLPALIIGTLINRPFHLREITLAILSFSMPFGYWGALSYLFNEAPDYVLVHKTLTLDHITYLKQLSWVLKLFLLLLFLSLIFGFRQFAHSDKNSNKAKSARTVTILIALSLLGSFVLNFYLTGHWLLQTMAFPVSFIIAYWFAYYRHSVIAPLFFYAICIVSFVLSFRLI